MITSLFSLSSLAVIDNLACQYLTPISPFYLLSFRRIKTGENHEYITLQPLLADGYRQP
ncbi:hypothetical protein [Kosakonia sacchari]|uniref:hypothetical protein n=1 Tax=Kosakonia sacchari TaxID=1158459 RepID=UPI003F577D4F